MMTPRHFALIAITLLAGTCASQAQESEDLEGARFGSDDRNKTGPRYGASMGTVTVGDTVRLAGTATFVDVHSVDLPADHFGVLGNGGPDNG